VVDPEGARRRLSQSKALAGQKVDMNAVIKLLTTLQGFTFTVHIDEDMEGRLDIDFSDSVKPIASVAKPLIIEAMHKAGVAMEDMDDWQVRAEGKTVSLFGKLSDKGSRQILSLIATPTVTQSETGDPQKSAVELAKRYFQDTTAIIQEIKTMKVKSMSSMAVWLEKYAQKIADLPTLDVDPELVAYATGVSNLFRALSQNARGVAVSSTFLQECMNNMQVSVPETYSSGWGGYSAGYGGPSAYGGWSYTVDRQLNPADFAMQQAKSNMSESKIRLDTFQAIEQATTAMRRRMTDKYHVQF
jgi:hypothetical protein